MICLFNPTKVLQATVARLGDKEQTTSVSILAGCNKCLWENVFISGFKPGYDYTSKAESIERGQVHSNEKIFQEHHHLFS